MRKLLAATALALTLLACGDDDSDNGDAADDAADTTAVDDARGTAAPDDGETPVSFSGEGSEEFCAFAADVQDVDDDDLARLGEIYDDAVDQAPAEIRDDFARLRDAFRDYVDTLEELGVEDGDLSSVTDPEQIAQITELLSDPGVAESTERVSTYITQVCGLE
jgi:hypothetical protein